jgi:hypothetical protein
MRLRERSARRLPTARADALTRTGSRTLCAAVLCAPALEYVSGVLALVRTGWPRRPSQVLTYKSASAWGTAGFEPTPPHPTPPHPCPALPCPALPCPEQQQTAQPLCRQHIRHYVATSGRERQGEARAFRFPATPHETLNQRYAVTFHIDLEQRVPHVALVAQRVDLLNHTAPALAGMPGGSPVAAVVCPTSGLR